MSEKDVTPDYSTREALQQVIDAQKSREMGAYSDHGKWNENITSKDPHHVNSQHTLTEIREAFNTGERIIFTLVNDYKIEVLNDSYYRESSDNSYEMKTRHGQSAIVLVVSEQTVDEKFYITGLDLRLLANNKHDQLNWVATCSKNWFSERNYNAGTDSGTSRYRITCVNGDLTWKYLGSS